MSAPGSPGDGGDGTQPALDPSIVLGQLATAVAQLAQSAQMQARPSSWTESKYVKAPEVFAPKNADKELALWSEWSFAFKQWVYIQDEGFRLDFEKAESADSFMAFEDYEASTKTRSIRLCAILATYLKGRPLRILRSIKNGDGFRVWRTLADECQPVKSRSSSCKVSSFQRGRFTPGLYFGL